MWGMDVESWARRNFASAQLGDVRRTRRLVQVAAAIARDPEGSLPEQLVEWSDLKAAYRLFDGEGVTFDAVAGPHWGLRQECGAGRCLLISDTASLNFTPQRKIPGLGPLGKGQGYGRGGIVTCRVCHGDGFASPCLRCLPVAYATGRRVKTWPPGAVAMAPSLKYVAGGLGCWQALSIP